MDAWELMELDLHQLVMIDNHVWHVSKVREP